MWFGHFDPATLQFEWEWQGYEAAGYPWWTVC